MLCSLSTKALRMDLYGAKKVSYTLLIVFVKVVLIFIAPSRQTSGIIIHKISSLLCSTFDDGLIDS